MEPSRDTMQTKSEGPIQTDLPKVRLVSSECWDTHLEEHDTPRHHFPGPPCAHFVHRNVSLACRLAFDISVEENLRSAKVPWSLRILPASQS